MLCERCKHNQATMHYTEVINGKVTEYHLCEKCAREEKLSAEFTDFDIFNMFSPKKEKNETGLICESCKTTLPEFKKTGIAGCSKCYETFASVIESMLLRTQGTSKHIMPEETKKEETTDEKIAKLQLSLKKAIEAEEYEKAAKIRDEIRTLKEEA
ncbi:MAG: UvrB/UvrC motif-containing protein [Clostridia bacterium]|nr:UvrB/UvrC motif-containing protein [Clostridia bacterium]